jgi:hypothetical protein
MSQEERDRLARIHSASPPASTLEGQLQRRVRNPQDDYEVVWSGDRKDVSLTGDWRSKERTSVL